MKILCISWAGPFSWAGASSWAGALAPALLLLLAPSPSHAQNREHQLMAAEQRIMMERLQLLETANEKTLAQLAQIAQLIKAVNDRIDASDAAMAPSAAGQRVREFMRAAKRLSGMGGLAGA